MPSRILRLLLLLVLVALLPLFWKEIRNWRSPRAPNIIILCSDALRADHLDLYGYGRPTSPNIDALARQGVRFDHAYATSSWTGSSILSLFTAQPPYVHGFERADAVFHGGIQTLAEALAARGYRTGAVSANYAHITPERGFARGFQYFNVLSEAVPRSKQFMGDFPDRNAVWSTRANAVALQWLRRKDRRPFFLYLHEMDTHATYKARPSLRRAFDRGGPKRLWGTAVEMNLLLRKEIKLQPGDLDHLVDVYDAAVASWDRSVGELLSAMKREGLLENTMIVILSDHGEEFGDHGGFFHGITLYEEMIHVPLVVVFPDHRSAGRMVSARVSLLDVAPTILEIASASGPTWHAGRSLTRCLRGDSRDETIGAELALGDDLTTVPLRHHVAVLGGDWKVLLGPKGIERYRLGVDPREKKNLASVDGRLLRSLLERAEVIEKRQLVAATPQAPPNPDLLNRMRSLGYVN